MGKIAWLNKGNHNVVRKGYRLTGQNIDNLKPEKNRNSLDTRHCFTLFIGKNQSLINFRQQNVAILKTCPDVLPGPLGKHHIMNITIGGMC